MVDLSGGKSPYQESIDNNVFIIPGIIIGLLLAFFVYKLVTRLKEKERLQAEKKKKKQEKKDQAEKQKNTKKSK